MEQWTGSKLEKEYTKAVYCHPIYLTYMQRVCVHAQLIYLCPTLCHPMDCGPPDSSVHEILQARILGWVALPSSRGSSWPRDQTCFSCVFCISMVSRFFICRATWETLYAENIMWNAGLDELQAGIKTAGRNINNLRHADDTTLMAESEEEAKSHLMRVKEDSKKARLKFNIKKLRSWHLVPSLHGKQKGKRWK